MFDGSGTKVEQAVSGICNSMQRILIPFHQNLTLKHNGLYTVHSTSIVVKLLVSWTKWTGAADLVARLTRELKSSPRLGQTVPSGAQQ